ncbi:hypothetical protein OESDEN_10102 [Oesophagostomum dentatum]|uniref:Hydroxysteroid dehydrogenase-like protein 2 n=1 Tax=Oesophagostomum dentatum TaxID=61180 RepID=A0A0B1T2Q0_OESDE|nr:hypothetical protein OESDEN_10102 [Oesophagostomum dentatum]
MKRYDLMHSINTRGTYLMSKMCLPYLKQGKNPHILNISPPLLMEPRWFSNHVAYTMAKYGMSMCVLGMHEEFRPYGIAVNALWPLTGRWFSNHVAYTMAKYGMSMCVLGMHEEFRPYGIAVNALWPLTVKMGSEEKSSEKQMIVRKARIYIAFQADIMADAAYAVLSKNSRQYTGNFAIDEEVLRAEGVTDFKKYAVDPTVEEDIKNVLTNMKKLISKELAEKMQAVYEFTLTGNKERKITLDLKNGNGSVSENGCDNADTRFVLADTDFAPIVYWKNNAHKCFYG